MGPCVGVRAGITICCCACGYFHHMEVCVRVSSHVDVRAGVLLYYV